MLSRLAWVPLEAGAAQPEPAEVPVPQVVDPRAEVSVVQFGAAKKKLKCEILQNNVKP